MNEAYHIWDCHKKVTYQDNDSYGETLAGPLSPSDGRLEYPACAEMIHSCSVQELRLALIDLFRFEIGVRVALLVLEVPWANPMCLVWHYEMPECSDMS